MKTTSNFRFRIRALLVLCLFMGLACAQGVFSDAVVTGTISGTIDGTDYTWQTHDIEVSGELQSTATYSIVMDILYSFSLQGHLDGKLVERAVGISFDTFNEPFVDCPCQYQGEITHWTTSSMFGEFYVASEATIMVTEAEALPDGSYRLVGAAAGDLLFVEDAFSPETTGDPIPVVLEFDIQRLALEELDY